MLENKQGVYMIMNRANGKVYIGASIRVKSRIYRHYRDLSKGKHHCIKLQRSYSKHGIEVYKAYILEYIDKNIEQCEQKWINLLKPDYNSFIIVGSLKRTPSSKDANKKISEALKGRKFTEEHKRNLSISMQGRGKGKILPKEIRDKIGRAHKGKSKPYSRFNATRKPVVQLSLEGELIREWAHAAMAAKELKIDRASISACCLNKVKIKDNHSYKVRTVGGYKWKFQ